MRAKPIHEPTPTLPPNSGPGVAVVDVQVDQHAEQDGQHEQQADRGDQRRPGEERHPAHAHARRPRREHGGGDRRGRRGEAAEQQAEGGEEQVDHVGVAAAGTAVVGQGDDDEHEPGEPGPEAGGSEAGEGQRAGADLQRHDGDGDAEQERDHHAVDEADAERREQLRQGAGVEERVVAVDALGAEQHAEHGAADEGEQRHADEQAADDLGVARRQPRRRPPRPPRRRAASPTSPAPAAARRSRRCQGRCRWCSSVVRMGRSLLGRRRSRRRRDIIGPPRGGPKSVPAVGSTADQDVDREGGEQHRDVGDAVREHLHARRRRRVAGRGRSWRPRKPAPSTTAATP